MFDFGYGNKNTRRFLGYATEWMVGECLVEMIENGFLVSRDGKRELLTTELQWISEFAVKVHRDYDHRIVTFESLKAAIEAAEAVQEMSGS